MVSVKNELSPFGPLAPRLLLGARLRALREARGITRETAGEVIRASSSKLSRLELGRTGFKRRDVADLLTLYGVDEAERATLLALVDQANVPAWWYAYGDVVPNWQRSYLGAEQAASSIRCFAAQAVPDLLQTEDYAREAVRVDHPAAGGPEVRRRVELRMRRQEILRRPAPVKLWAALDEAVLRRSLGDCATMRAQLEHLVEVCRLPNVVVQIVPFNVGGHAAAGGSATLVRLPQPDLPDMVYLEQLVSAVYPDKPAEVECYRHVFNTLVTEAAPPEETPEIIRRVLAEHS